MQQLYKNAATIPSSLRGGACGHIGLVMEPMFYSSLSATTYNAPSAPTRTTLPSNASLQVRYNEDSRYRKELDTYENHIAMDDVMKKQFQDAVEDVYIQQLRHKFSAYLGVTARDVLDHLMDWYKQIKPANLVANGENYNKPMDISQPIDAYFAQIDDCIQYTLDGKTPYISKQILTTVPHAMQKTGWFKDGIRPWKARDLVVQTWQNFKKDFAKEYDEIKEEQE
eukprot:14722944-Ditylum_brightwellii.AAC.1